MSVIYFYVVFASYPVVEISTGMHKNASLSKLSNYRSQSPVFFFIVMFRHSTGRTMQSLNPTTADITMLSCCSEKITLGNDKIHVMMCFFNLCSINQYDLCDDWHATRSTAEGRRVGGRPPRLRLFHVPCRRASWGVEQTRPPTADITMLSCCSEKITLGDDKIHVMRCFFNLCSINQYDLCDDWHATRSTAEGRRVGGRPPRLRLFHVPCRRASWGVEQTRLSLLLSLISLHSTRCT